MRVPFIVRDPRLGAKLRGGTRDQMTLNIDVAPTILSLAGVAPESGMQGRDVSPLVRGERSVSWRDDWYYEHTYNTQPPRLPIPACEGVRSKRWKYVRYTSEKPAHEQLFDLASDPVERHNLAGQPVHRAMLDKMRARCDAYVREAK